jgi:hypothetical protein
MCLHCCLAVGDKDDDTHTLLILVRSPGSEGEIGLAINTCCAEECPLNRHKWITTGSENKMFISGYTK